MTKIECFADLHIAEVQKNQDIISIVIEKFALNIYKSQQVSILKNLNFGFTILCFSFLFKIYIIHIYMLNIIEILITISVSQEFFVRFII